MASKTHRLFKARERIRDAETAYADLLRKLYPAGCSIQWSMGGYRQHGHVVRHSRDRLVVHNEHTEKRYWIDSYHLRDDDE